MEIELSQLELRYAHTRVDCLRRVLAMSVSMEREGQKSPVGVVKGGEAAFVLIDGYVRVQALRRCGRDTVLATLYSCEESEALVQLLRKSHEHRRQVVEEALLLQELKDRHRLPLGRIASLLGCHKSWVSRRIQLVEALPEEILALVQRAEISAWAATRVLLPLARANAEHAHRLGQAISKATLSTRQLATFYEHYCKANRTIRQRMVQDPVLFIKALREQEEQREAEILKQGPEGRWVKELKTVSHILGRLTKAVPDVLYGGQQTLERRLVLTAFTEARGQFLQLDYDIRRQCCHDTERAEGGSHGPLPKGNGDPGYQSDHQALPQCGPTIPARGNPGTQGAPLQVRFSQASDQGSVSALQG